MYRWLPKYEFKVEYYERTFRFSPATNDVKAWAYYTPDDITFTLVDVNPGAFIELKQAVNGIAVSATALLVSVSLLNF